MSAALTPKQYADRVARWRKVGYDYAQIQAVRAGLELDRQETEQRTPKKTGKLARTIRIIDPRVGSAERAIKLGRASAGTVRIALAAGSRARGDAAVPYARVLQTGEIYPGRARTKPHVIQAFAEGTQLPQLRAAGVSKVKFAGFKSASGKRLKLRDGGVRSRILHPGSRFTALRYLDVKEERLTRTTDAGLQVGINKELG